MFKIAKEFSFDMAHMLDGAKSDMVMYWYFANRWKTQSKQSVTTFHLVKKME